MNITTTPKKEETSDDDFEEHLFPYLEPDHSLSRALSDLSDAQLLEQLDAMAIHQLESCIDALTKAINKRPKSEREEISETITSFRAAVQRIGYMADNHFPTKWHSGGLAVIFYLLRVGILTHSDALGANSPAERTVWTCQLACSHMAGSPIGTRVH